MTHDQVIGLTAVCIGFSLTIVGAALNVVPAAWLGGIVCGWALGYFK